MNYLYHWLPKDMQGNILYPLNVLKQTYPELYDKKASKYKGREEVMRQVIPALNCLWNDVLHFTAIHPTIIKQALIEAGDKAQYEMICYEVDPHLLDLKNTIVYLYEHTTKEDKLALKNFSSFNPDDVEKYSHLNQDTKNYYKKSFENAEKPLVFHRVPHILYKGAINISNVSIIKA